MLFFVIVQDTIIQSREYVVMADSADKAVQLVSAGHFISESVPSTMDTVDSEIVGVEEIVPEEFQQGPVETKEDDRLSDLLESILSMDNPFNKAKELRLLVEDLRKHGN